jgi:acetyl-CoA synthetase
VLTQEASSGYEAVRASFRWRLPSPYNLGVDVSDRQPPAAPAILVADGRRVTRRVTFGELADLSNRFANALRGLGVEEGDRVAILLPQRLETAVAHIAVYKLERSPSRSPFSSARRRSRYGWATPTRRS